MAGVKRLQGSTQRGVGEPRILGAEFGYSAQSLRPQMEQATVALGFGSQSGGHSLDAQPVQTHRSGPNRAWLRIAKC